MLQYAVFDSAGAFQGISEALRQVSRLIWGHRLPLWDIFSFKNVALLLGLQSRLNKANIIKEDIFSIAHSCLSLK